MLAAFINLRKMRWEPWKSEAKNRRVSLSAALAGVFLRNRDI
jgi:hypothetical protein